MQKFVWLIWGFSLLGSAYAGTTIELNGRTYSAPWHRDDQGRLFVQDHWVRRTLGATFLSSDQPDRQRYQWYSSPAFAGTMFSAPSRLVQIGSFKGGWRTEAAGNTLRISTPDTQITQIRRNSTATGERITLTLSRPTPWQMLRTGSRLTVTVAAEGSPPDLARLTGATARIPSLRFERRGKESSLELQFNPQIVPQVRTLSNPPRIVVDLEDAQVPAPKRIAWQRGITWREEWLTLNNRRFRFYGLEIDPKQVRFRPIWASPAMTGSAPLSRIAGAAMATAAINGGFFNRDRQLPLGPIKRDGVWHAGAVFQRGAVAWNDRNEFTFDRLEYREAITVGTERIQLTNLNSGFVQRGIARYLPSWGEYTNLTDNETIVTVQNNQVVSAVPAGEALTQRFTIPADGYLLVGRQVPEISRLLPAQATIRGEITVRPQAFNQLPHLLGGGPLLIKDGKAVTDAVREGFSQAFSTQAASRSAIARLRGGNLLLMTIYPDPTLDQTTRILQNLGAIDALNLDGGGSGGLWLGGAMLDRSGETRSIHNALGVFVETDRTKESF